MTSERASLKENPILAERAKRRDEHVVRASHTKRKAWRRSEPSTARSKRVERAKFEEQHDDGASQRKRKSRMNERAIVDEQQAFRASQHARKA